MSLRERKKQRQREELIANAVSLFRERGFEATRVREIAEHCDVSEATFFNYFPSKHAGLGEWARAEVERTLRSVAEQSGDRALRRSARTIVRELASRIEADEPLQRSAWSCARLVARPAARGAATTRDGALLLVERARERGELRNDVPATQLAELLGATICSSIAHWLAADPEAADREPLELRLGRAVDLLLDGYRKRNERVSSAAPRDRPPG
jgi:AcrR family transcriptional regulator